MRSFSGGGSSRVIHWCHRAACPVARIAGGCRSLPRSPVTVVLFLHEQIAVASSLPSSNLFTKNQVVGEKVRKKVRLQRPVKCAPSRTVGPSGITACVCGRRTSIHDQANHVICTNPWLGHFSYTPDSAHGQHRREARRRFRRVSHVARDIHLPCRREQHRHKITIEASRISLYRME
jgi:hypothetical protein